MHATDLLLMTLHGSYDVELATLLCHDWRGLGGIEFVVGVEEWGDGSFLPICAYLPTYGLPGCLDWGIRTREIWFSSAWG